MNLLCNQIIESGLPNTKEHCLERILWINSPGGEVALFDIVNYKESLPYFVTNGELSSRIYSGESRIFTGTDPYQSLRLTEHWSDAEKRIVDLRWNLISPLVGDIQERHFMLDKSVRGKKIAELGVSGRNKKREIYQFLRLFWRGGQTKEALLPELKSCGQRKDGQAKTYNPDIKRGRRNDITLRTGEQYGINADEGVKRLFRVGLVHFKREGHWKQGQSLSSLFRMIKNKFFNIGYIKNEKGVDEPILPDNKFLPSETEFRYWFNKEYSITKRTKLRYGKKAFNQKFRSLIGDSRQGVIGPGSFYQIDATILDVYLVSSIDRKRIIGKAVLYVVIDVFSELIVGFALTLEGPSWAGAELALLNTFSDKVEFCHKLGIEIENEKWPSKHKCERILADNGEFRGLNSDGLPTYLDVDVSLTPAYRPDWKAYVERFFLVTKGNVEWLPGMSYPYRRGDPKYKLDACLTLHEMRQILADMIVTYNNFHVLNGYRRDIFMIPDDVKPIPIDLWNWGIKNRSGQLSQVSQEKVWASLLPKAEASVTDRGIFHNDLYYICKKAIDEEWLETARIKGRWPVKIAYDYNTTRYIYLFMPDGDFIYCNLMQKDVEKGYDDKEFYEIADHFYLDKQNKQQLASNQAQEEAKFAARSEAIVENAELETMKARGDISDHALMQDIRENRAAEKAKERKEFAEQGSSPSETPMEREQEVIDIPKSSTNENTPPNITNIYRQANAKKIQEAKNENEV